MSVHLLGTAQDAGVPHAGCSCSNCTRAWSEPQHRRLPASLALRDDDQWFLIDATPAISEQLHRMSDIAPDARFSGLLLTHLHMGHYTGLLQFGRESMSTRLLPLYATRQVITFLEQNEPWKSLIEEDNIAPQEIAPNRSFALTDHLSVMPIAVPHRAEYSDTMAFVSRTADLRLLYLPDIDGWSGWDRDIRDVVEDVDVALLDATFFSASELPGRDLAGIPHPFVVDTVDRLHGTTRDVRLIHLNHSNPLCHDGPERRQVEQAGLRVANDLDAWNTA